MPSIKGNPDEFLAALRAKGIVFTEKGAKGIVPEEVGAAVKPTKRKKANKVPLAEAAVFEGPWYVMFTIPLRVVCGDNSRGTKFKIGRGGHEKETTIKALARGHDLIHPYAKRAQAGEKVGVKLTRLGPVLMDDDNAMASLKFCRDSVAMFLGVSDGPKGPIVWSYGQRKEAVYGVEVVICTNET
jgi:hypothetical protein